MRKVIKLSSKGQITLPKEIREDLKADKGDLLIIYKFDDHRYVIEKRTPFAELTEEIAQEAKRKGYTEDDLKRMVEKVRDELWKELYAKHL